MIAIVFCLLCAACSSDSPPDASVRPVPLTVVPIAEPQPGHVLSDPSFVPLPDAAAHYGRLGGAVYQVEVPKQWNGDLVMFLQGTPGEFRAELTVEQPRLREYLISEGYAWAASSFSRNDFRFQAAAIETAALWDKFVADFGRPQTTILMGESSGGGAALYSSEHLPNRYDGVLALCPAAGTRPGVEYFGNAFLAAAFAAGMRQDEFSLDTVRNYVAERVLPALERDEEAARIFSDTFIALTGGPRPFAVEALDRPTRWYLMNFGAKVVAAGSFDNTGVTYISAGLPAEFNESVIRVSVAVPAEPHPYDNLTGSIRIPVLTLHTTGDALEPLIDQRYIRELAEGARAGDKLVQREIQGPYHCRFPRGAEQQAFEDLVRWIEDGDVPSGHDTRGDWSDIGDQQ